MFRLLLPVYETLFRALPFCLIAVVFLFTSCGNQQEGSQEGDGNIPPRAVALSHLVKNQYDEAEAAFLKAIQQDPKEIANYSDLSLLYILQKNYEAAEKLAQKGLKVEPGNTRLQFVLVDVAIEKNEKEKATALLNEIIEADPKNARAYYRLSMVVSDTSDNTLEKKYLLTLINIVPANIVPRLQLSELFAAAGNTDSCLFYLESVKKISPDFLPSARSTYQHAVSFLQSNQPIKALPYIRQFINQMKITNDYGIGEEELQGPKLIAGYPIIVTGEYYHLEDEKIYKSESSGQFQFDKLIDASTYSGLTLENKTEGDFSIISMADIDANGNRYIYMSKHFPGKATSERYLFVNKMGLLKESIASSGIEHSGRDLSAVFSDFDNDGYQDLFIVTTKGNVLYKNLADDKFLKMPVLGKGTSNNDRSKVISADFDQDGDLDFYIANKGANEFYRNNGDETFTENAAGMGLAINNASTIDLEFGDFDQDGDLDIIVLNSQGGLQLFDNLRHSKFKDITQHAGFGGYTGTALGVVDYNNDGLPDILLAGGKEGKSTVFKNMGEKRFLPDTVFYQFSSLFDKVHVHDISFLDIDNDGYHDVLISGVPDDASISGVKLFHNDSTKGFSDISFLLPPTVKKGCEAVIFDFSSDGDEDIILAAPGDIHLIRNDGGNINNYMQVQLKGLSYGNSKNNRLGIGAQVELKAGDLYQLKTATGPIVHFGVGPRDTIDVLRIIWPNGVPQTIVDPSLVERLVEEEKLKGSCPFLFTWNGKEYEFIKDMMWRSALGMPLAVKGKDTVYAFSDASKEYLLIPGDKLKPLNDKYSIKITEELWETVYFDKAALIAVDHPEDIDVFVDEKFVLPPFPGRELYHVKNKHLPLTARDEKGNDLLSKITEYDFQYISNFSLGKYQGLAEDHELILDLGNKAIADSVFLFMRGWTFPTDASINAAMTQAGKYKVHSPSLQVMNKKGEWETVIKDLGFPMGKDKMVITNLSGKFLTKNNRLVKIKTNMQIYWDHIFFSTGNIMKADVKMYDLPMAEAELNYRGYSAYYKKGGPFGPMWFDHSKTTQGQQWRDLTGYYTRYGDVLPLVMHGDDQYIIANSGDEITIDFDASGLPALPKGWKRDFLIYSEGWVKDGDLNTAHGQTVEPLPFHSMPSYPYDGKANYPSDEKHRKYREQYNTREVNTDSFRNFLRDYKK